MVIENCKRHTRHFVSKRSVIDTNRGSMQGFVTLQIEIIVKSEHFYRD